MSVPAYKRVILVTGSNTGIGYEVVKNLAEKGHRVYLAARNEEAGVKAEITLVNEGLDVKFIQLDVTSPTSVAAAAEAVQNAEGRLDSLVNNAGVAFLNESKGPLEEPLDLIQKAMNVNFFGLVSVCKAFVPLLLHAEPGHACILNVTTLMASNSHMASLAGKSALDKWVAYNTSKAAANSYTISLAKELKGKVKVNAAEPGFVSSKLNGFMRGGKTPAKGAEILVPWALLGLDDKKKTRKCLCVMWHIR